MATTKTMRIVRKLAGKDKTVFNDKLVGGERSIKVWGWREADYDIAMLMLFAAGCRVRKVLVKGYSARMARDYRQVRLHVID